MKHVKSKAASIVFVLLSFAAYLHCFGLGRVWVCPLVEKDLDDLKVPVLCGAMERCDLVHLAPRSDPGPALREEGCNVILAVLRREVKGRRPVLVALAVHVGPALREQLHHVQLASDNREGQGRL